MSTNNATLIAAFMTVGLVKRPDFAKVLEHYDGGMLELIDGLTDYADFADALMTVGFEICGNYPGVGVYEVAEPFGAWFGGETLLQDEEIMLPEPATCTRQLRKLTLDFYREALPASAVKLIAALSAVPEPVIQQ